MVKIATTGTNSIVPGIVFVGKPWRNSLSYPPFDSDLYLSGLSKSGFRTSIISYLHDIWTSVSLVQEPLPFCTSGLDEASTGLWTRGSTKYICQPAYSIAKSDAPIRRQVKRRDEETRAHEQ